MLFFYGHESSRFYMLHFFILGCHDGYINYIHVGSTLDIFGDHLYMDMYVPEIRLFDIFTLFQVPLFEPMILVSLVFFDSMTKPFLIYNLFQALSYPLT